MTNQTAIFLALAIVGAVLVDFIWFDLENALFLAVKFDAVLDWLAFWR